MSTTMRQAVAEPAAPLELTAETTIGQLIDSINETLEAEGLRRLICESDGLSVFPSLRAYNQRKPGRPDAITSDTPIRSLGARWLICYAVPGSNEGYYLTLAAVVQPGVIDTPAELYKSLRKVERRGAPTALHLTLATGKTFIGMRGACEAAARISELLERWDW